MKHNKEHYDSITEAWKLIMGNNFHYGYYRSKDTTLESASHFLIEEMSSYCSINEKTKIIDIGCGIGTPSFYLRKRFNPQSIIGISTSPKGIESANKTREKHGYENVKFIVADALESNISDNSFNLAWIMESSHLMRNKDKLFSECNRLLGKNSQLVLCDIILKKELDILEIFKLSKKLKVLENSFGKAKMETLQFYKNLLQENGFNKIKEIDISDNVIKTLYDWKANTKKHENDIIKLIGAELEENFIDACEILIDFFNWQILGYGIIKAEK